MPMQDKRAQGSADDFAGEGDELEVAIKLTQLRILTAPAGENRVAGWNAHRTEGADLGA